MAQVINGRYTARMDGPFVVFMIGMRVNRPLAFRKWFPTAAAMGPMLRELYSNPQKGFLGAETFVYWPGVALVRTGARSRIWRGSPEIRTTLIFQPGSASIVW